MQLGVELALETPAERVDEGSRESRAIRGASARAALQGKDLPDDEGHGQQLFLRPGMGERNQLLRFAHALVRLRGLLLAWERAGSTTACQRGRRNRQQLPSLPQLLQGLLEAEGGLSVWRKSGLCVLESLPRHLHHDGERAAFLWKVTPQRI